MWHKTIETVVDKLKGHPVLTLGFPKNRVNWLEVYEPDISFLSKPTYFYFPFPAVESLSFKLGTDHTHLITSHEGEPVNFDGKQLSVAKPVTCDRCGTRIIFSPGKPERELRVRITWHG